MHPRNLRQSLKSTLTPSLLPVLSTNPMTQSFLLVPRKDGVARLTVDLIGLDSCFTEFHSCIRPVGGRGRIQPQKMKRAARLCAALSKSIGICGVRGWCYNCAHRREYKSQVRLLGWRDKRSRRKGKKQSKSK